MERRRAHMDIIAEILRIAREGAKKTHIVYGANINFKLLQEYLEELEGSSLIVNEKGSLIRTTGKGVDFLNYYAGLKQFGFLQRGVYRPVPIEG